MSSSAAANGTTERTENDLTIEQLAAQTGIVRNVRDTRPGGCSLRRRCACESATTARARRAAQQIRELQDEGFNLNGIKRLLEDQEGTAERLLHFKRRWRPRAAMRLPRR